MQLIKKYRVTLLLALTAMIFALPATAQKNNDKQLLIKNAVDSQRYIFIARYASPLRGGQRYLNSEYSLEVRKDSIVSYLPYFGVAYQAPMNPAEGGIKFTSTKFDYTITTGKKQRWQVNIKPADAPEVQQLSLTIFTGGEATLQVISTNKQSISFSGYITKLETKK